MGRRFGLRAVGVAGLLGAVFAAAGVAAGKVGGPEPAARVAPAVAAALREAGPDGWAAVGITLREPDVAPLARARPAAVAARQGRVLDALPAGAFRVGRRYGRLAGLALRIRPAALTALERHPDVRHVYLDGRVQPSLVQGVALVGADDAHAFGVRGAGVNVAVLDSGIDADHPDLVDDLVAEQCFCSGHPSPSFGCCPGGGDTQSGPGAAADDDGHGTSVAGIITSGGVSAPLGVAPDAGVVAVRVLGPGGGSFSDIAAGLDWVLANAGAFADPIRVVNLSLGDGGEHSDPTSTPCSATNTANAIAALHAAGISVFAASGNDGHDAGISFPACVAEAVSVGGVYDASFGVDIPWCADASCSTILCTDTDVQVDDFVCHSNSGAILDLLAPDFSTTTSGIGGGTTAFGGTSAASPYAAAQAALLLEADGTLLPDAIRDALRASGVMVTNPDNGLAFPRSDVGEVLAPLLTVCGNGVLEAGEACDDGNTVGGDCCAADCTFEAAGASCDDGDACTTGDACDGAGTCQAGAPLVCSDGNPCTDDACDPATGCVFAPNTAACDDGDACTVDDVCSGGACQPGAPLSCSDGEVCTDDLCDPATGCVFPPNTDPCDDGDACSTGDQCSDGVCQGGPPPDCDDGDPCTAESCDAVEGCVSTPVPECGAPQAPAVPGVGIATLAGLLLAAASLAMRGGALRPR